MGSDPIRATDPVVIGDPCGENTHGLSIHDVLVHPPPGAR